jgi:hypothetical protein
MLSGTAHFSLLFLVTELGNSGPEVYLLLQEERSAMKMLTLAAIVAAVLLAWTGAGIMTESGVKEPPFQVEREGEGYVIRLYKKIVVAEVEPPAGEEDPLSAGFRQLFLYIGGENLGDRKIVMTAPVLEETLGKAIPMTAPVLAEKTAGRTRVAFVLPPDYTLHNAPAPRNPAVVLREIPPRRLAVLRFSGYATKDRLRDHTERLQRALARDGLVTRGEPLAAYYNPPWTPPFMRRNEVMIELSEAASTVEKK